MNPNEKTLKTAFEWDTYFENSSYNEVRKNSPMLGYRRHPTTFSPDGDLLYLTSMDLDVNTEDAEELDNILKDLADGYRTAVEIKNSNYRIYAYSFDFELVCGLLDSLGYDGYQSPNALIEEMGNKNIKKVL